MTDELLENIIQLEKQIQTEVAAERAHAEEWQRRELAQMEKDFSDALKSETELSRQKLVEKKAVLQSEGAALEEMSSAWCRRLLELDEATLRNVLKRRLSVILPGGDHDHPHGQS